MFTRLQPGVKPKNPARFRVEAVFLRNRGAHPLRLLPFFFPRLPGERFQFGLVTRDSFLLVGSERERILHLDSCPPPPPPTC